MSLTLEFLGSGDAFASGGRFHSCTLVTTRAGLALVDCGASSPVALARRGIAPADIGIILLTHLHGDHFGGVPFLLIDAAFNRPRTTPLTIAGPAGLEAAILRALEAVFAGTSGRVREAVPLRFVELPPLTSVAVGEFEVTAYPVTHSSGVVSQALRLGVAGRIVAFSSDTEWDPRLVEASRDADVFVCECTAYRGSIPGHLSLEQLRRHASALSARRIVLNHLGREMLEHVPEAPWECAADGMVVAVGSDRGQTGVRPGSDPGQTGVRPGSDPTPAAPPPDPAARG